MMKRWTGLIVSALLAAGLGRANAADMTVWGLQAFNPAADAYIGDLVKEYGKSKNISAEYVVVPANVLNDKLAAAFAAGAPPDAFMNVSAQGLYYMSQGLTAPLDDVLADMRKVPGGIYENTMPQAVYDGKVQALPIEVDISPMYARKDLLAKVGMPIPETWRICAMAAKAILKADPTIQRVRAAGLATPMMPRADPASHLGLRRRDVRQGRQDRHLQLARGNRGLPVHRRHVRRGHHSARPRSPGTMPATTTPTRPGARPSSSIRRASIPGCRQTTRTLLANTALINLPKGPGAKGAWRRASVPGSGWCRRAPSRSTTPRAGFAISSSRRATSRSSTRWAGAGCPIYPSMMSMPLFKDNPDYANFGDMAASGIIDGYEGPPTAWASKVNNAKVVTQVMQKILVDRISAKDAVAWGIAEIEKLK